MFKQLRPVVEKWLCELLKAKWPQFTVDQAISERSDVTLTRNSFLSKIIKSRYC